MKRFCDFVQQSPDGINWTVGQAEFDDLLALKKDSMCWWPWFEVPSFVLIKPYWREVVFLIVLLKVGPSLSLRLLMLMSIDFVQLRLQGPLPLLFVEAFTGTLCNASPHHRDASPLGR